MEWGDRYPRLPLRGLRQARLLRMLTQPELARRTKLSHGCVSMIEAGIRRAQPNTARALADALDVNLGTLVRAP